jgi:hypothetical protein
MSTPIAIDYHGITILDDPTGTGAQLLMDALKELAVRTDELDLSAIAHATIGASSVIPTAFTIVLPSDTAKITIIPRGTIYWNIGAAATVSTAKIPSGGFSLNINKTIADTIRLYAVGAGEECDILVFVPRS